MNVKLNKLIIIGLILGFIISLLGLIFMASCPRNSVTDCLIEKEDLMPDFYWHINTIKYISSNWELPYQISEYKDESQGGLKDVIHGPLYYFIGAGLWSLSMKIGVNPLIILHLFSIFLTLIANILFFLLIKRVSKDTNFKKQFILVSILIFIFFPLNLYISLIIHNHALFLMLLIFSFYLYSRSLEQRNLRNSCFLGISLGLGLLSSSMIIPLFLAIFIYTFLNYIFKKDRNIRFIALSLILGFIIGFFTLIRNYLLYGNPIWGRVIATLQERSFFNLVRVGKAFFSGAYGGFPLIVNLISIISIFITIISVYGFFCWINKERGRKFKEANVTSLIFLTGIITLVLSFHSVCNLYSLLNNFICLGGDMIHGRHLLPIVPSISISFALGLTKLFRKRRLIACILMIIIILYSLDFLYVWIN